MNKGYPPPGVKSQLKIPRCANITIIINDNAKRTVLIGPTLIPIELS